MSLPTKVFAASSPLLSAAFEKTRFKISLVPRTQTLMHILNSDRKEYLKPVASVCDAHDAVPESALQPL